MIHRFLSKLWSSSPAAQQCRDEGGPSATQVRSMASRLLSPSSSDDERDGCHMALQPGHRLKSGAVAATQTSYDVTWETIQALQQHCDQTKLCKREHGEAHCFNTTANAGGEPATTLAKRRKTASKSRPCPGAPCSGGVLHAHRSSALACMSGNSRSESNTTRGQFYGGDDIVVGARSYTMPQKDYWDPGRLASFQLAELALYENVEACLTPKFERTFAGIQQHCQNEIERVMQDFGGPDICVFKIGVSSNVQYRVSHYMAAHFSKMRLLHNSTDPSMAELLEVLLIAKFRCYRGCRNIARGGEGSMASRDPYGPYFVYVVAARADGKKPIGS